MATYARWFPHIIWGNIWHIITKFDTQKQQRKTKTTFEPVDLNLTFKVTKVIYNSCLLNIWGNIWRRFSKLGTQKHQSKAKTKFVPLDLDLISRSHWSFKMVSIQYLKNVWHSLSKFGTHRSTRARRRPSSNWLTLTKLSTSRMSFV